MGRTLSEFSDQELAAYLARCQEAADLARLAAVSVLVEARSRKIHRGEGVATLSAWVAGHLPVSGRSARDLAAVAAKIEELPALGEASAAGVLSWDQLVAVIGVAEADTDAAWAELAQSHSPEQLAALARRQRREAREADADADRKPVCRVITDDETGSTSGWFRLFGPEGASLARVIEHLARHEFPAGPGEEPEAWDVRCGRALGVLGQIKLAENPNLARATINVHIDLDNLLAGVGATLSPGDIAVAGDVLERMACNGRWRLIFDRRDGEPEAYSHVRSPSPVIEDAVKRRDVHCVWKGCRSTHGQVHHICWWSKGGKTVTANLTFLCWRHHRLVHEGGWKLTGTAGNLTVRDPNDRVVFSTGPPAVAAA